MIPTAKAILAGERFVHSSTHLVTPSWTGAHRPRFPARAGRSSFRSQRRRLLPEGAGLSDVIRDINL